MATSDIYLLLTAVLVAVFTVAGYVWLFSRIVPRRKRYYPALAVLALGGAGGSALVKMVTSQIEVTWLRWCVWALLIPAIVVATIWLESQVHKLRRGHQQPRTTPDGKA